MVQTGVSPYANTAATATYGSAGTSGTPVSGGQQVPGSDGLALPSVQAVAGNMKADSGSMGPVGVGVGVTVGVGGNGGAVQLKTDASGAVITASPTNGTNTNANSNHQPSTTAPTASLNQLYLQSKKVS